MPQVSDPSASGPSSPVTGPEDVASRIEPRSGWDTYETFLHRVEMIAKPAAFLLAIMGLVGFYVPSARRIFEELVMPTADFQVGKIWRSLDQSRIIMSPADYDSPAWNGALKPNALFGLVGSEVLTTDTAVGRASYSVNSGVVSVLEKNQCLHVLEVAFMDYIPGGVSYGPVTLDGVKPGATAEERLRLLVAGARRRGSPNCQMLTEAEWRARADAKGAKAFGLQSYKPGVPICPRTAVWINAQKVTC